MAEAPGTAKHGLLLRDEGGKALVIDRASGKLAPFDRPGVRPDLTATHEQAVWPIARFCT